MTSLSFNRQPSNYRNHEMQKLTLFYVDWLLLLALALVIGCFLCGTACITLGQEPTLWQMRAAAAIAIHNVNPQPLEHLRPEPSNLPSVQKPHSERPRVTMYSATWCVPCQKAKAELQGKSLPFELKIVDVSHGGQPDWCDSIPAFAWQVRGQTRYVLGFPGVTKLIAIWQTTREDRSDARTE